MKDLFVSCPFHTGDRTPSLSILLQDKGNLKAGFAHCFACGWSGSFRQVEKALGYPLDIDPQIRAVLDGGSRSSNYTTSSPRAVIRLGKERRVLKKEDLPFKFSPYLKERGIGEVAQRFNKVYQNGHLNMPFFDPWGNWLGSVERSVGQDKFYKVNGSIQYPIGIEEIRSNDFVYITEGQIDKMSLEEAGFRAVALGTVSNYRLIRYIKNFNICLAFDNDEAGKKATERAFQFIIQSRRPNLYSLILPTSVKDLNELLVSKGSAFLSDWVKRNTRRF